MKCLKDCHSNSHILELKKNLARKKTVANSCEIGNFLCDGYSIGTECPSPVIKSSFSGVSLWHAYQCQLFWHETPPLVRSLLLLPPPHCLCCHCASSSCREAASPVWVWPLTGKTWTPAVRHLHLPPHSPLCCLHCWTLRLCSLGASEGWLPSICGRAQQSDGSRCPWARQGWMWRPRLRLHPAKSSGGYCESGRWGVE